MLLDSATHSLRSCRFLIATTTATVVAIVVATGVAVTISCFRFVEVIIAEISISDATAGTVNITITITVSGARAHACACTGISTVTFSRVFISISTLSTLSFFLPISLSVFFKAVSSSLSIFQPLSHHFMVVITPN